MIRILINHLHYLSIQSWYNLDFPNTALIFYSIPRTMFLSTQIFIVTCNIPNFYMQVYLLFTTPLLIALVGCFVYVYSFLIRKKNSFYCKEMALSVMFVIIYILHPSLARDVMSIFVCEKLNIGILF